MKNKGSENQTLSRKDVTVNFTKKRKQNFKPKTTAQKLIAVEKEMRVMKEQIKINEPPLKNTYNEGTQDPGTAWVNMSNSYPVLGGAENQRINEIIHIKSISCNFTITASSTDGDDTMRVIFIQYLDENDDGNLPSKYQEMFLNWSGSYPTLAQYQTQVRDRYRVLFDKTYNVNVNGNAQVSDSFMVLGPQLINKGKLVFDLNTEMSSIFQPGLSTGLVQGWCCSDSSASPNPEIEYTFRTNFTDS